jgi:hypothetical protein
MLLERYGARYTLEILTTKSEGILYLNDQPSKQDNIHEMAAIPLDRIHTRAWLLHTDNGHDLSDKKGRNPGNGATSTEQATDICPRLDQALNEGDGKLIEELIPDLLKEAYRLLRSNAVTD